MQPKQDGADVNPKAKVTLMMSLEVVSQQFFESLQGSYKNNILSSLNHTKAIVGYTLLHANTLRN